MFETRHWHVVGQGAIGSFCAANVLAHNHKVTVIGRPQARDKKSNAQQMNVTKYLVGLDQTRTALPAPTSVIDCSQIANLLIAVKAYDVVPALEQLIERLTPTANIVLCHNGLGTLAPVLSILEHHPNTNLYFCTTSSGAHVKGSDIIVAAIGDTYWQNIKLGVNNKSVQFQLEQLDFDALFIQAQESINLQLVLWRKLLINCAINPLTAQHQVNNGTLAKSEYETTIKHIIAEVIHVANSQGVALETNEMTKLVYDVIHSTANNRSSMCQDVANGKQTEIDYINGHVSRLGLTNHIPTPVNARLVETIRNIKT